MKYIPIYLIIVNAIAFLLMLADKRKAKKKQWRIPERVLFGSAIVGGSIGAILGMYTFRHKTKHTSFTVGMPVILALQVIAVVIYFLTK